MVPEDERTFVMVPGGKSIIMPRQIAATALRKLRNFIDNTRQLGPTEAAKLYRYRLSERYHDWRLGIRTTGMLTPDELGGDAHCQPYEAIHYGCLRIIMDYFDPTADRDILLDYGSGMGRAVVIAATRPFRKVIGVELSTELCEIARENARRALPRLVCQDIEIVAADATAFEVPGEVTAVFLFNPFTGPILRAVQDQIRSSIERAPREFKLVYMHPSHEPNTFDDCQWLVRDRQLPTADWDDVELVAYRPSKPFP